MIIRELEKPKFRDLIGWYKPKLKGKSLVSKEDILSGIKIVGSGSAALAIILKYLIEKKFIYNKLDEMIVADWVGYDVYKQIQTFVFPAKKFSDRTKIIFAYHQYGFPQDMDKILEFANDKKLVVIEDCANAIDSYYKGKKLGSMGDFSIYSFSKWFFCFSLGGVKSKSDDFPAYADKLISEIPFGVTLIKDSAKFLSARSMFSKNQVFKKYVNLFLIMSYALSSDAVKPSRLAEKLLNSKLEDEINIRQKRYYDFLEQTKNLGICDHLEKKGVTPYVIPIRCSEFKNEMLLKALRDKGIVTGLYHFDMNRNLLSPKFEQCVWIPCHSGIPDKVFFDITETVVNTVKK